MALLNGTFYFKTFPDGSVDRSKVICTFCQTEFKYHRSTSSLSYHLRAKHSFPSTPTNSSGQLFHQRLQSTILECANRHRPVNEFQPERLNSALPSWLATDRRPVDIMDESGVRDALRLACYDQLYVLPSQGPVVSGEQDETEKVIKQELLESENAVSLSGDHWTSGAGSGDDQEQERVRDEKEQHCPLPVVSTSLPLVEPCENSHQEMEVSLKRRRRAPTETEITSAEALSNFRDEDELFLLSLLPSLKRLTIKKRMEVRMKFQQVLYDAEFED
ncbi:uncharacterized protein LOC121511373 [Cheilinus undulatus]|uniref:uncharacterized protein LOC121511373 n=1 Tax=Cheilinus undulatus TaxID=241271 RepID=UPI001BD57914|nr:uncharacterized protein LOC121511373 [Cheilinus undulatus]